MSDFISVSVLKNYETSLLNRDFAGQAKTIFYGGTQRARISSQCMKYAMNRLSNGTIIRSSKIGKYINSYIDNKLKDDKSDLRNDLCEEVCKCIGAKYKKDWATTSSDNKEESEKGATIVVIEKAVLNSILEKAVEYVLKSDPPAEKKDKKKYWNTCMDELKNLYYSANASRKIAMYGKMDANDPKATVYGAIRMSHMYSVDRFRGESDDWIAKFQGTPFEEEDDELTSLFNSFIKEENTKTASDAMGSKDIYANLMFGHMAIDIRDAYSNLEHYAMDHSNVSEQVVAGVTEEIEAYILANPEAHQRDCASAPTPSAVYIEVVKDGAMVVPNYGKCIDSKNVEEDAIKQLEIFARDTMFRTGEIHRYVMLPLSHPNRDVHIKEFSDNRVSIIHGMSELKSILSQETMEIIKNY